MGAQTPAVLPLSVKITSPPARQRAGGQGPADEALDVPPGLELREAGGPAEANDHTGHGDRYRAPRVYPRARSGGRGRLLDARSSLRSIALISVLLIYGNALDIAARCSSTQHTSLSYSYQWRQC